MKIIRYSTEAFKPQYQSYHINYYVNHYLSGDALKSINDIEKQGILSPCVVNDLREMLPKQIERAKRYKEILGHGVWAFIDGHKSNICLNHLNKKVPCWEADIDDNAEVIIFDVIVFGGTPKDIFKVSDPICKCGGFYIPEKSMSSIKNVKRRVFTKVSA